MKKLLYLLLLLPLNFLASCDDDDNMPDVRVDVSMSNVTQYEGIIYVVQGDTLVVNSVTVESVAGGRATLTGVEYVWDIYSQNMGIGYNPIAPFGIRIPTNTVGLGNHLLQLRTAILQVDKSVANALISYPIKVVESADDIPSTAPEKGTYTASSTGTPSK